METELFANLAGNLNVGGGLAHSVLEEFEFTTFTHLSGAWQYLQWSPVQNFRVNYYVNAGEFLAYNAAVPRIANGVNSGMNLNIQLFGKLQMNFDGNYSTLWDKGRAGSLYNGWIWRGVARYNPNRFVQARLIAQWDGFSNRLLLQPLLQYQPSPFTLFYIGSSTLSELGAASQHQLFAKVQITLAAGRS